MLPWVIFKVYGFVLRKPLNNNRIAYYDSFVKKKNNSATGEDRVI